MSCCWCFPMGPLTQMHAAVGRSLVAPSGLPLCTCPWACDVMLLALCHGAHDSDARCGGTKAGRTQLSPAVHVTKDMWCHVVWCLAMGPITQMHAAVGRKLVASKMSSVVCVSSEVWCRVVGVGA